MITASRNINRIMRCSSAM